MLKIKGEGLMNCKNKFCEISKWKNWNESDLIGSNLRFPNIKKLYGQENDLRDRWVEWVFAVSEVKEPKAKIQLVTKYGETIHDNGRT
jgi:hypothetical protein